MTITTLLNLLHFVYKYVVLFCESSSADTACKFLEVFFWFRGGRTISKICFRRVNGLELRPFEITLAQCWQKRLAGTTRFKWYEKRTNVFLSIKELLHSY